MYVVIAMPKSGAERGYRPESTNPLILKSRFQNYVLNYSPRQSLKVCTSQSRVSYTNQKVEAQQTRLLFFLSALIYTINYESDV